MSVQDKTNNMALFCDFENIALGVRDARYASFDMKKVVDHFSRRCRAVRLVPFDPHLEEGAEISLDRLRPDTRDALLELAVAVADGFPLSL